MRALPTQQAWNCCVWRAGGEAGTAEGCEVVKSQIAGGLPFLGDIFSPLFWLSERKAKQSQAPTQSPAEISTAAV